MLCGEGGNRQGNCTSGERAVHVRPRVSLLKTGRLGEAGWWTWGWLPVRVRWTRERTERCGDCGRKGERADRGARGVSARGTSTRAHGHAALAIWGQRLASEGSE